LEEYVEEGNLVRINKSRTVGNDIVCLFRSQISHSVKQCSAI